MKDITNQTFGALTALYQLLTPDMNIWHCRCQCGREVDILYITLLSGNARSCGCLRSRSRKDLTGQQFGMLTVLSNTQRRLGTNILWHCRCDCGRETDVTRFNLLSGNTRSCGCLRNVGKRDIAGQRFGKLVALYPTEKRKESSIVWHCRCDCGEEKDVSVNSLIRGDTRSWGV